MHSSRLALILFCTGLAGGAGQATAAAVDTGVGGGVVETGDDRFMPMASAHLGVGEPFVLKAFLHGERYGIVRTRGLLMSASYRTVLPLFGSKRLTTQFGFAFLADSKRIASTATSPELHDTSYSAGCALGLSARLATFGTAFLNADWQAHIFPAGWSFLLLASGRRQTLGFTVGVEK